MTATGDKEEEEKRGLGKVVYSVDPEPVQHERQVTDNAEVTHASKESFPASDPPGFAGADIEEQKQAEDPEAATE